MELRRLRYFLRIAAEGSLGKASAALGVAQPALGRQIQILESELGVKLFRRVPKGMILTDEGEYLKEALAHPLELVNTALGNVRSYRVPIDASLVLGLPPVIAEFFGPRLIARLQSDFPNLGLRIAEGDSAQLAENLAHAVVDIALLTDVVPPDKIFHYPVMSEPLLLVASPASPAADRQSFSLKELQELRLILPGTQSALRTKLAKLELAAEVVLNIALEIDSTELTKQAVRAGHGHAILPRLAFQAEAERHELIGVPIVEPEIQQSIRFAVRPLWRVPRSTYVRIERAILEEWFSTVSSGEWPGEWLFDMQRIAG